MINQATVVQQLQSNHLVNQHIGKINHSPEKGLFLAREGTVVPKRGIQGHHQKVTGHAQDLSEDQSANQGPCLESEGVALNPGPIPEPNDPGPSPHDVADEQDLDLL